MSWEKCLICKQMRGSDSRISFYGLPKTPERRTLWINSLKLDARVVRKSSLICSAHFSPKQIKRTRLIKKAVPRILFPNLESNSKSGTLVSSLIDGIALEGNSVAYPEVTFQKIITQHNRLSEKRQPVQVGSAWGQNQVVILDTNDMGKENCGIVQKGTSVTNPIPLNQLLVYDGFGLCNETNFSNPHTSDINQNRESSSVSGTTQNVPQILTPMLNNCNNGIAQEGNPVAYPTSKLNLNTISELRRNLKNEKLKVKYLKSKQKLIEEKFVKFNPKIFNKSPAAKELLLSQINRFSSNKNSKYTSAEKTLALTMYYTCGRNGYSSLRKMLWLPSLASLRSWIMKLDLQPGINALQMDILSQHVTQLEEKDKDCVFMWDEVSIKELIEYNKYKDTLDGLQDHGGGRRSLKMASEALVVMVRGLRKNWKFPISFYFSKDSMTSDDLQTIILENLAAVKELGLRVRVGVCDMGFTNQGLYRRLGVSEEKPYIELEGNKIYMVHDTPHLIKLVRNSLLAHNFIVSKKRVKWSHILNFWRLDCKRLSRMCPKLSKYHFCLKTYSRMKVKWATQIFSHSVYAGMLTMIRCKRLSQEAKDTADFVRSIDQMFDLLNISTKYSSKYDKAGINVFHNIEKFDNFISLVKNIEVPGSKICNGRERPDCLVGLELTLRGVKGLLIDLQNEGYEYVLTRRIQQDGLEHLFSFIRMRGGWCRNPTARQFRQNFRFTFFSGLVKSPVGANCEAEVHDTSFARLVESMKGIFEIKRAGVTKKCTSLVYPPSPPEIELEDSRLAKEKHLFYKIYPGVGKIETNSQIQNVATYMSNAVIKCYLKKSNCQDCIASLLKENIFHENDEDITLESDELL